MKLFQRHTILIKMRASFLKIYVRNRLFGS